MACQMLDMLGFKNTYNVEGGILAWQEKYGTDAKK
jgi:rhodanese-related sulfurtransferase